MRPIYPVPVKPPSQISTWDSWPKDVRSIIRHWNKKREVRLSFVRTLYTFKCDDCDTFCHAHSCGAAVFPGELWVCDDCLIQRARRMIPIFEHYGEHTRAGRQSSCICHQYWEPIGGLSLTLPIHPDCAYHALAAEFPLDHSIPWNCATYYDGCNCIGTPGP